MGSDHPERTQDDGLQPTVGEHLRLGRFLKLLDEADEKQLKEICRAMAEQVLVVYPSAMRFMAREAARNLKGEPWSEESSNRLLGALQGNVEGPQSYGADGLPEGPGEPYAGTA